jgi:hypothetical protein
VDLSFSSSPSLLGIPPIRSAKAKKKREEDGEPRPSLAPSHLTLSFPSSKKKNETQDHRGRGD